VESHRDCFRQLLCAVSLHQWEHANDTKQADAYQHVGGPGHAQADAFDRQRPPAAQTEPRQDVSECEGGPEHQGLVEGVGVGKQAVAAFRDGGARCRAAHPLPGEYRPLRAGRLTRRRIRAESDGQQHERLAAVQHPHGLRHPQPAVARARHAPLGADGAERGAAQPEARH